jgi:hypothetical protein
MRGHDTISVMSMRQSVQDPNGENHPKVRICMATMRSIQREAFRCGLYEAQDVLAETNDVDLIDVHPGPGFPLRDRLQRSLLFRGLFPSLASVNPGMERVRLTRDYDLFVVVCQNSWDLLYINAIDGWKERCKVSACWLDELWATHMSRRRHLLSRLKDFDYVFVSCQGAVDPLSDFLDRRCYFLPSGTDTIRFTPFPHPPARAIDVYAMGRRWQGIHRALLGAAAENELFYLHDTYHDMAQMQPIDYREHRQMFANIAKRSRYFLVAPAKMDATEETRGQVEMGHRYFEGAAAGAVMIGQAADSEAFRESFSWPDAVVEIRPDGSDTLRVLAELDAEPERVAAIGRRNAVESLLRHDWLHRWMTIFELCGLEASPRMKAREERLKGLAHAALSGPMTRAAP